MGPRSQDDVRARTHLRRERPSCGWQADGVWTRDWSTGRRRSPSPCCSKVGGRCYSDSPFQCCSACCCLSSWSPSSRGCSCETDPHLSPPSPVQRDFSFFVLVCLFVCLGVLCGFCWLCGAGWRDGGILTKQRERSLEIKSCDGD